MQKTLLAAFIIAFSVLMYSCGNSSEAGTGKTRTSRTATKEDTLSNEQQCVISIDDKKFTIPADSVSSGYTFSDSSLAITFKGVGTGRLVITIPNLFKCPCPIPTGYSSVRFKIAGSDEYSTEPTAELYNYPVAGTSFNNLDDGYHKKAITGNAIEITSVRKTNENTNTNWAEYLIKGKIHTMALKNVYEVAAGNKNKDYAVKGSFVISSKIYF